MNQSFIADTLASVGIGQPLRFENLVMFPLLEHRPELAAEEPRTHRRINYNVLDDAITGGFVEITEVSDQGSVPELRVLNRGQKPTLIVDGEELVGARQNRVASRETHDSQVFLVFHHLVSGRLQRWRIEQRAK